MLVGLVIALVVFLLQAAAGQSFRADSSYRAMLSHTHVVWPLVFALVFIGWVAVLGRFENPDGDGPPAWAETWALGFLLLQLLGFGAVFVLLLRLVSPRGLAGVVEKTFTDGIRRSVEQKLVRKLAAEALFQRCLEADVSFGGFMSSGRPLALKTEGWIRDVDLGLPGKLRDHGFASVVELTVELGQRVDATMPVARVAGVVTPYKRDVVGRGLAVRRGRGTSLDPLEVFAEALDIAHRAIRDGGSGGLDIALDLIVACVEQLPLSYALYGFEYGPEVVNDRLVPSGEDRLLRSLRDFCRVALLSGDSGIAQQMPFLAYRIAQSAIRVRSPALLHQATNVWLNQARVARDIGDDKLRQRLLDQIAEAARLLVQSLSGQLEDHNSDVPDRVEAYEYLKRLFSFQVELLRLHGDAADIENFKRVWRDWVDWGKHWEPGDLVEDLEFDLGGTSDLAAQRVLRRRLDDAREIAAAQDRLVEHRELLMFQLGAWLMWRYRDGELAKKDWSRLVPYLLNTFTSTTALTEALPKLYEFGAAVQALRSWEPEKVKLVSGQATAYYSDIRLIGGQWATLLLLRGTKPDAQPDFPLRPGIAWQATELKSQIQAIAAEPERWEPVVEQGVTQKAEQLTAAIDAALKAEQDAGLERLATEPLDPARVADFARANRDEFAAKAHLRKKLLLANAATVTVSEDAFSGDSRRHLVTKRPFIREPAAHVLDWDEYGRKAAVEQDAQVVEALIEIATPEPSTGDPVAQAVAAIKSLRDAGFEPDAVFGPFGIQFRVSLGQNEHFVWAPATFIGSAPELGHLDGVPVYNFARNESQAIAVAHLGKAIHLTERRLPATDSSLYVSVEEITEARARELVNRETLPDDENKDEFIQRLHEHHVEIVVATDFVVEPGSGGSQAAVSFPLPPTGEDGS